MHSFHRAALATLFVALLASPALAAWPNSPFTNLPVCTVAGGQYEPNLVPDGAGGAIITWYDFRPGGNFDIYAQHVRASGSVDPAWPANGRAICSSSGDQYLPTLVSDGAGGALITWTDLRSGSADIYAQHVLASGVVDPAWPANGRVLCTAAGNQDTPMIESDGAGGAIVAWLDFRGGSSYDIYAQRVLASGVVDPAWPVNGALLCAAAYDQQDVRIVTDGAGGAIVTWVDFRSGIGVDVYAQRVRASGTLAPSWPTDGLAVCTATDYQLAPRLVSDDAGGAIVTWYDFRSGVSADIYAQHVLGSGTVDLAWPYDGLALCTAAGGQQSPAIAKDGAGGAIVAWHDLRGFTANDIYAQHVTSAGSVDPAWPLDGSAVCTAIENQYVPTIYADGEGGAIVAWSDYRGNGFHSDLYAQHMLASGTVDPAWPAGGRALCAAANGQSGLAITSDGAGGAIAAWHDNRNFSDAHIYAQRVARFGYLGTPEAEIVSVKDVPNDQGGRVKLSWNASYLDLAQDPNLNYYDVLRSVPTSLAAQWKARGARVRALAGDGFALRPGDLVADATGAYYWEYLASISALHYLSGYSYIAPTLGDSVAGSNPRTAFMVVARNWTSSMFWLSRPDSGYSTDNLAPAAPAPFTGEYAAGTTQLHWNRNVESDLAGYRLYRGTTPAFVPGPGNLVAAVPDTGYADTPAAPSWYKLTAVDSHGNESPVATLLPAGTLGVEGAGAELSFAVPMPNPASARTTLRWALSRAGSVRVAVYDAAGRRVRELANGVQQAGEHSSAWDLSDDGGRAVGAGLYFARFEAEGRTLVRRVAVTR